MSLKVLVGYFHKQFSIKLYQIRVSLISLNISNTYGKSKDGEELIGLYLDLSK